MKSDYIVMPTIVGIVLSLLTSLVLFRFNNKKSCSQRILGYYFLTLGFGLCLMVTLFTDLVKIYPHFFRTVLILAYVYPPLAYLYVRQNTKKINRSDFVHFLPPLLYIIDYLPFFLLSSQEKLPIVLYNLEHSDKLMAHGEGWITFPWFHMVFRNLLCLFYWILSVRVVLKLKKSNSITEQNNSYNQKWLYFFVLIQLFFFLPYIVLFLIGQQQYNYYATVIPVVIMSSFSSVLLFFEPTVFYGITELPEREKPISETISNFSIVSDASSSENLSEIESQKIAEQLNIFMASNKPFLNKGYSIHDFAKETGISVRKLSTYLNKSEQYNYSDYINRFRIEYCLQKLNKNDWQNLTLEAISIECGFHNRNSFTTAFKKSTGLNPSDYVKNRHQ